MTELIGALVGSIRIDERLGGGGMGEVFRGFDTRLERSVAVKTVRSDRRLSAEFKQRFRREAKLLSKLGHPGICQVYDLIETPDADFLVLEFLEGATLDRFLLEGMSRTRLLIIFAQVANALAAAHGQSVVHRDLKPENIHIGPGDRAKILDFGIARSVIGTPSDVAQTPPLAGVAVDTEVMTALHTTTGNSANTLATELVPGKSISHVEVYTGIGDVIGTRGYMSPEQAAGQTVGTASDIYALGLCLDRALEHAPARGDEAHREVLALVARMLVADPRRRPSAAEVEQELLSLRDQPRRAASTRVRWRLAMGAGVALLLLSGAMLWLARDAQRARAESEQRRALAEDMVDYLLGELREQLLKVGRIELLDSVNQRAKTYLGASGVVADDRTAQARSRLLGSEVAVLMRRGDYAAGEKLAQAALPSAKARADASPKDPAALQMLAEVHYWLGYLALEQLRDPAELLPHFDQVVKLRERAHRLLPNRQHTLDLAQALASRVAARGGRGPQAVLDAERAVELHRSVDQPNDAKSRGDFAAALGWLSATRENAGDLTGAATAREENVQILSQLSVADPNNAVWSQDLAIALHFRAVLAQQLGQDQVALLAVQRSCDMLRADYLRDPQNRENQRAHAVCQTMHAGVLLNQERFDEARTLVEQSSATLEQMIEQAGAQSDWPLQKALSALRRAEIEQAAGHCDAALPLLSEFAASPAELVTLSPSQQARVQLVEARCARNRGDGVAAQQAYTQVLATLGEISATAPLPVLTLAAIAALESRLVEPVGLLKLLADRGYRGTAVVAACRAARHTPCLP